MAATDDTLAAEPAVERPLTAPERTARAASVAAARARGEAWAVIAARHGLSERQARRVRDEWIAHAAAMAPVMEDPGAVLREVIEHHRAALLDLTVLSREGNNMSARVGAAKGRAETARALLAIMGDAGLVPESGRGWAFAREVGSFTKAITAVCRRRGIPLGEVMDELMEVPGFTRALEAAP